VAVRGAVGPTVDDASLVDRDEVVTVFRVEDGPKRPSRRLREVDADEFEAARPEAAQTIAEGGTQRSPIGT